MRAFLFLVFAALGSVLFLAPRGAVPQAAAAPHPAAPVFEEASCDGLVTYRPEGSDLTRVRCGYVTVPENRSQSTGRTIRIAIAVIKSKGSGAPAEPLVFLTGGPGQGAVDDALYWGGEAISGPIQTSHDIVFFDPRGTGHSGALRCPEYETVTVEDLRLQRTPTEARDNSIKLLTTCGQRYRDQGIDLSQYNSAAITRDTTDVMHALGYTGWSLIGVSYGTRYALTMMRDTPAPIHAVILDSTVPLQQDGDLNVPRNFQDALANLSAACRESASCAAAYPALEQQYWESVARANANPIPVSIEVDGSPVMVWISGDTLLSGTFLAMYDQTLIPALPFAANDIAAGNTGVLTLLAQQLTDVSFGISDIMSWAVRCNEDYPFYTEASQQRALTGVRAEILHAHLGGFTTADDLHAWLGLCTALGTKSTGAVEGAAVKSAIPALILSGDFDYVTPPGDAALVHADLSSSYLVRIPYTTHAVTFWQPACSGPMMSAFLAAPRAAPDTSCTGSIPPYAFAVPEPAPPPPAPPPPPPPTAVTSGVITAPNTGSGPGGENGMWLALMLTLATAGSISLAAGALCRQLRAPAGMRRA